MVESTVVYDCLVALFLAGSFAGEPLMDYTGKVTSAYPANFMAEPSLATLGCFALVFSLALVVLRAVRQAVERRIPESVSSAVHDSAPRAGRPMESLPGFLGEHAKSLAGMAAILVAAWSMLLLYFFPGTSMNDQIYCIDDPVKLARTHPLVLNLALSGFTSMGRDLLGSSNVGLALYVVVQIVICAAIVSFCCAWMRYRGVPIAAVLTTLIFFAFEPLVSSYSVSTVKDTPFSYAMLLWVPFLYEATLGSSSFWRKTSSYVALAGLVVATSLTRNNGLILSIVLVAFLALLVRKRAVIPKLAVLLLVAVALALAPGLYAQSQGIHHLLRETLGIPLQQVAAVDCEDGSAISEGSRAFLDELFPKVREEGLYWPATADGVKFGGGMKTKYLQSHGLEFARVYVELGLSNPMQYARAYGSATYGNWSLIAPVSLSQSRFTKLSSNGSWEAVNKIIDEFGLHNHSLLPEPVDNLLSATYVKGMDAVPGCGACFFAILLLGYALSIRYRSGRILIIVAPYVLLWATLMLATPLSTAFRYVFPMMVAIPFLASLLFARIPVADAVNPVSAESANEV